MKAIVFTPDRNTEGKHDYTGAFLPEATAFAKQNEGAWAKVAKVDISKPVADRRSAVEAALSSNGPLELVAFFCHGWNTGIQLGYSNKEVTQLAAAIAKNSTETVVVALYCCSTAGGPGAGGDGGFADKLRDALCAAGKVHCEVNGHERPGHCSRLPYVRRFEGRGSPTGGTGGTWIVAPGSPLWPRWKRALQSTTGDLRLRFPTMSVASVHRELLAEGELVA